MRVSSFQHEPKRIAKYLLFVSCDIVDFMNGWLFHLCSLNVGPVGFLCLLTHKLTYLTISRLLLRAVISLSWGSRLLKLQAFPETFWAPVLQIVFCLLPALGIRSFVVIPYIKWSNYTPWRKLQMDVFPRHNHPKLTMQVRFHYHH